MSIETYCNHCDKTINTLLIMAGQVHHEMVLVRPLEESDLICGNCYERNISLRVLGGTIHLISGGHNEQEAR